MSQQENPNEGKYDFSQPEPKIRPKTQLEVNDWLCINCYNKITSEPERFFYENFSEFEFTNPNGYRFSIITFGKAGGCVNQGFPTMEFTWFPEHAWSFSLCGKCGLHLGWKYIGKYSFYGLIRSRLLKGEALFN